MPERPPTLEYQKPADYLEQPAETPQPKLRRRWIVLCWLPPFLAVVAAGVLSGSYGGAARMPRGIYNVEQSLLSGAFWWVFLALVARGVIAVSRWL